MSMMTFRDAISRALEEALNENEDMVIIGDNMSKGGKSLAVKNLDIKENNNIIDFPPNASTICEIALGMANMGDCVVAEIDGDKLSSCTSVFSQEIAPIVELYDGKIPMNLVVRADIGRTMNNAPTRNIAFEASFQFDGLTVLYPSSASSAYALLKEAIKLEKPVLFLEDKNLYDTQEESSDETTTEIGKANIIKEGTDVSVIAYGSAVNLAREAVQKATENGVSAELIDLLTICPLDFETIINSVAKTGRAVIVQDANTLASISSEISALISESEAFDYLESPILRVGQKKAQLPYSMQGFNEVVLSADDIYEGIMQSIG